MHADLIIIAVLAIYFVISCYTYAGGRQYGDTRKKAATIAFLWPFLWVAFCVVSVSRRITIWRNRR